MAFIPRSHDPGVAGTNGGLAFDNSLNLLVTNSMPLTNRPALIAAELPLAMPPAYLTPSSLRSPVRSDCDCRRRHHLCGRVLGSPRPVRRIPATGICPAGGCKQFTVATDSTACIGIDLAPDQTTLYYVSGGRKVRTVTGADAVTGDASAAPALSPISRVQGPHVVFASCRRWMHGARPNPAPSVSRLQQLRFRLRKWAAC